MVDREEEDLKAPKATVGRRSKHNMEWSCEGSGWITILNRSQYGTDLSR